MPLKTTLVVVTGVAGAVGVGAAQVDSRTAQRAAKREPTVSLRFQRASVDQVIQQLSREGISFVVRDEDLLRDKKITLNIVRQPLRDAMGALGSALGGRWQRTGSIFVFQKGQYDFGTVAGGRRQFDRSLLPRPLGRTPRPIAPGRVAPPPLKPFKLDIKPFKLAPGSFYRSTPISPPGKKSCGGARGTPTTFAASMRTPRSITTLGETFSEEQKEKDRRQGFLAGNFAHCRSRGQARPSLRPQVGSNRLPADRALAWRARSAP